LQHDLHDDGDILTSDHVANHDPQYSSALTRESDIYALAMTAIEIFTGNIPSSDLRSEFQVLLAVVERRAWPELPSFLDKNRMLRELMHSCWSKNPKARPSAQRLAAVCTKVSTTYLGRLRQMCLVGACQYDYTSSC